MPRAHTPEEMREMFLDQCRVLVRYWANADRQSTEEKISGAIFSVLNIIDGCSGGFPCALDLVTCPHEEDKQYDIENGDNWVEPGMVINDTMLHEHFYDGSLK